MAVVQGQSGKVHIQQTSKPPYLCCGFRCRKAVAGIAWVPLLCVRSDNHLVHENT